MTQIDKDALNSYKKWAIGNESSWISDQMQDFIPHSMKNAIDLAKRNFGKNLSFQNDRDLKEKLGKIFEETTKKYNLFTEKAKNHLEVFYQNGLGIEVAHQPKFLGGERFVYNKLSCGAMFAQKEDNFFPFFYNADYDKVHPELIKTHFPLYNSKSGFSSSISNSQELEYNEARIKDLPLPTEEEINNYLKNIKEKYLFSIKAIVNDKWQQKLIEERFETTSHLIKSSWAKSKEYPDLFVNIIGNFSNIVYNQGFLFLSASDPEYRKLLIPQYEFLLKNQEKYYSNYDTIRNKFLQLGINPPLREIKPSLIPFFYECQTPNCFHQRIQLHHETRGSKILIKGICSKCKTPIEFETYNNHPDLSDIGLNLTPRVESRQNLVSSTIPIGIHVAGTGEARYYTMGIPIFKNINPKVILPVIYFYNKTTMNTVITRNLEQQLIDLQIPGFLDNLEILMKNTGKFNKLCKKQENEQEFSNRREKSIELLNQVKIYLIKLEETCNQYIKENPNSPQSKIVAHYLSNMFGKISKEKHGQEAVFNWIDLSIKNGLTHLLDDYKRFYKPWLPPGLEILF